MEREGERRLAIALLNYTTTIAVEKSLGEIHRILARAGAKSVLTDYEQGEPSAIAFVIPTAFGDRPFRLPANINAVLRVLERQYEGGRVQRRFVTQEQAARVGWRIVKDWLEAQLAIIETEMVSFDEIFLPYLLNRNGKTLYELMVEQRLALPEPREGRE